MLRTILITGASSGIGAATAIAFAKPNNRLILVSRKNREGLKKIEDEGRERGAEVLSILADVSDYEACKLLVQQAVERFGTIDLLVNDAGVSHIGLFQDMTPDEWQRVMNVNIGSVMNLCHLVIPSMVHRHHGRIINISSVWGNVGASCEAVYSASKGAINSFTKALAKELAPSNIQVNAIAFGAIETPMNAWLSKEEAEALADEIPAGREGTKEEAAQMICMVADAPDYLTGQIITMDGGWI
ncbi:SDR family NAD(P)-dependent oxidoreductase [Firmicutes bacterium AF25-13AC]|jgi:3-oxoacyl-[acyl-carrier protein] reductase|nr:SDR family NAD(P)-dependent oxidoreductase [Firmicutes bacterium AF25-13AC]